MVTLYLETIQMPLFDSVCYKGTLYKKKMVKTLSEAFVRSDTRHQFERNFLEENKQKRLESSYFTKEDGKE